jgi:hypothetical protein
MEKHSINLWPLAIILSLLQSLHVAVGFTRPFQHSIIPSIPQHQTPPQLHRQLLSSWPRNTHLSSTDKDAITGDDCTLQTLVLAAAEQIKEYRANSSAFDDNDEEAYCRSLLAVRRPKLAIARCHVAQSAMEGAGHGVFASRDIAAGELITVWLQCIYLWCIALQSRALRCIALCSIHERCVATLSCIVLRFIALYCAFQIKPRRLFFDKNSFRGF